MDRPAKLQAASLLLDDVMVTLDVSTRQCPHCNHISSVDQEQRTQYEMLNAARERINKVLAWMRRQDGRSEG